MQGWKRLHVVDESNGAYAASKNSDRQGTATVRWFDSYLTVTKICAKDWRTGEPFQLSHWSSEILCVAIGRLKASEG